MNITVAEGPVSGVTVLALRGELGVDTVQPLRDALDDVVANPACRVVVDLAGLEFCDSIGLSSFVDAHRRCSAGGGFLRLAAPTPFLLRVLAVVGLLGQVPVYDTVAAACAGDESARSRPPTPA
jgi:anti-sigma B factor antagonist